MVFGYFYQFEYSWDRLIALAPIIVEVHSLDLYHRQWVARVLNTFTWTNFYYCSFMLNIHKTQALSQFTSTFINKCASVNHIYGCHASWTSIGTCDEYFVLLTKQLRKKNLIQVFSHFLLPHMWLTLAAILMLANRVQIL